MRGQYQVWVPVVQIPGTEASIAGLIVPANTLAQLNRIVIAPARGGASASNNISVRLRRFTGNTPTLSNGVTAKAVGEGNALAATVTMGARGSAGTGGVWSATPTTPESQERWAGSANAFGGQIAWASSLQESREIGGASASYYDLLGEADANVLCSLLLVFSE